MYLVGLHIYKFETCLNIYLPPPVFSKFKTKFEIILKMNENIKERMNTVSTRTVFIVNKLLLCLTTGMSLANSSSKLLELGPNCVCMDPLVTFILVESY